MKNINITSNLLIVLIISFSINGFSQKLNYVEFNYQYGGYLKNSVHSNSIFPSHNNSLMFEYGKQTTGKHQWEKSFNYPKYGLGGYVLFSGAPDIFGTAYSVFTFLNTDIVRKKNTSLFFDFAPGINYSPIHYDSITNPRNDIISTNINFFINMRLGISYRINKFNFILSGHFTHFSNGATNMPNKGLNMYGLNLGVRYRFYDKVDYNDNPVEYKRKKNNIYFTFSSGWKETLKENEYNDRKFPIFVAVADYSHYFGKITEFGMGLDIFYDGSFEYYADFYNKDKKDYLQYGFHISNITHIHNLTTVVNLGTYLINTEVKGLLWSRLGLRYNYIKRSYVQIALKTQFGAKADFIEWGMGVNF